MGAATETRKQAIRFILLLGLVSLLADITYEGARGITGLLLGLLGASAVAVAAIGPLLLACARRPDVG